MRIVAAVIGLLALVSVPAHAAWLVKLKTGEVLTVQSYWRDGDKTHLVRGGVDIIVDNDRIESMEDGAPEPETGVQSATARRDDGAAKSAADADPTTEGSTSTGGETQVPSTKEYRTRLGDMTTEQLRAEERQVTKALLDAQAARFHAKFGGATPEELKAQEARFKEAQRRESTAETMLKTRTEAQ